MRLSELEKKLDSLYQPHLHEDACHNGLVMPGQDDISHMTLGVSLNRQLIAAAIAAKSQAVLVHHGLFLSGNWSIPFTIYPWIKELMSHDISLFAYHLPMDAHPELSHNRYLIDQLHGHNVQPFSAYGLMADLPNALKLDEILALLPDHDWPHDLPAFKIDHPGAMAWNHGRWLCRTGPERIHRVAVVSGRGGFELSAAAKAGAELFISGEISEHMPEQASILNISLIGLGHYLSETGGLIRLSSWLKDACNIDSHVFLQANPF